MLDPWLYDTLLAIESLCESFWTFLPPISMTIQILVTGKEDSDVAGILPLLSDLASGLSDLHSAVPARLLTPVTVPCRRPAVR